MSSFSTAWAVELHLRPSRLRRGLGLALHALALLALTQAGGMHWGFRLLLAVAVAASALLDWRGAQDSLVRLREVGEEWWLDRGDRQAMVALRSGRAWRWLVVMDFMGEWQGRRWRQRVVVWPDALPDDDFRRLRVRLRCGPRTTPVQNAAGKPGESTRAGA